jgi:hypothetical protein
VGWAAVPLRLLSNTNARLCALTPRWPPTSSSSSPSSASGKYSEQKLILGTHTADGEPNFLMLATVRLPLEDAEASVGADDGPGDGSGGPCGKVDIHMQIPHNGEVNRCVCGAASQCGGSGCRSLGLGRGDSGVHCSPACRAPALPTSPYSVPGLQVEGMGRAAGAGAGVSGGGGGVRMGDVSEAGL